MKRLLIFILLIISGSAIGQKLYFRADSSLFYRVGGSNELIIENSTKGITGVLVNYGNGRTRFSKPRIVGDTLFVGVDTILGVGSGAGSTNSNVGSAFRLAIPNTNNIKTLGNRYGISLDSSTGNQIGIGFDSSTVFPHIRATVPSRRFGVSGEDDVSTGNRSFNFDNNSLSLEAITSFNITGGLSASGPVDINWTELRDVVMTTTSTGGGSFNFSTITADNVSRILMSQDSIRFEQSCLSGCGDDQDGMYLFPNVNYNTDDIGLNRIAGFVSSSGRLGGMQVGDGLQITATSLAVDRSSVYNNQTGTSYTLQSSDNGKIVTLSNAGAITLTVPSGLPAGFNCTIVQLGAGVATVTPSSTTVNNADSFTQSGGQYSAFTILQYATNTFLTQGKMQ